MLDTATESVPTRQQELKAFILLSVFLAPALVIGLVGSYGFAIWIYQLIAGPPGV
ncbi:MAG: periplasmic nitrate reductase, NapE protein [Rhodospirillales bacterium]|nr:periplasmic nitrate reductase, NapE protein [Rhodospirillales bacterium]